MCVFSHFLHKIRWGETNFEGKPATDANYSRIVLIFFNIYFFLNIRQHLTTSHLVSHSNAKVN